MGQGRCPGVSSRPLALWLEVPLHQQLGSGPQGTVGERRSRPSPRGYPGSLASELVGELGGPGTGGELCLTELQSPRHGHLLARPRPRSSCALSSIPPPFLSLMHSCPSVLFTLLFLPLSTFPNVSVKWAVKVLGSRGEGRGLVPPLTRPSFSGRCPSPLVSLRTHAKALCRFVILHQIWTLVA